MAEVKWIKIVTDIFDDEKIYLIEDLPEADSIIVIWFKLLCLAGKQNNSGVFMLNDRMPYTEKMLASIFRRKESTVKLALETFSRLEMIEIVDGAITIPNWGKYQSTDLLQDRRDYMRNYMSKYREKQKQIAGCKANSKVNSKVNVNLQEEEIEVDIEEDKERDIENTSIKIDYQSIVSLFNSICVSYSKVQKLSNARKKAIKARINDGYTFADFEKLFKVAQESPFLKGKNNRNWQANFDWLIKDANMAKVLDGNYNDKVGDKQSSKNWNKQKSSYDIDKIKEKARRPLVYQSRNESG